MEEENVLVAYVSFRTQFGQLLVPPLLNEMHEHVGVRMEERRGN
jgi:hypothetical protein